MTLIQTKERKNSCKRYCQTHKMYYEESCFLCECVRITKSIRRLEEYEKKM